MADRDDQNLKHFQSRSTQTRGEKVGGRNLDTTAININLIFDGGFGGGMNNNDDLRFKNYGTDRVLSPHEQAMRSSNNRRQEFESQSALYSEMWGQ